MKRKVKEIVTIVVVLTLAAASAWKGIDLIQWAKESHSNEQTQESGSEKKTFPYKASAATQTYTYRLQKEQIKETGVSHYIPEITDGQEVGAVEVQIENVQVSRELPEEYRYSPAYQVMFKEENMTEDGTFVKDFYYLNVHIKISNQGDNPRLLLPSSLDYMFIDDDLDAWDIGLGSYEYSGVMLTTKPFYYHETGDSQLLATSAETRMANKGEGCEFDACYVIADQMYEDNQLHFIYSFGEKPDKVMENPKQIYIKCDMKE